MLAVISYRRRRAMLGCAATLLSSSLLLQSHQANATLLAVDLITGGDGAVTRDTRTGLEWLDLALTDGWSVNDALASEFVTRFGYRLANAVEVDSLLESAGVDAGLFNANQAAAEEIMWVSAFSPPTNNIQARDAYNVLSPLLGFTQNLSQFGLFQRGVNGVFANNLAPQGLGLNTNSVSSFRGIASYRLAYDVAGTGANFADSDDDRGVYLVRNVATVSSPGTLGMLALALGALCARFGRKR